MGTTRASDAELVAASLDGQRAAFGELVARYQDVVYSVSYSSTGNWTLSEDVAQETFIAAWRQLRQLRETTSLRSWLCTIARNLARKARKRVDREQIVDDDLAGAANPFDDAAQAEIEQIVQSALARVPDTYREALVLYYREHDSIHDVASALGISEGAALQRLARGRKYLADGVTALVERSLRGARPRRNLVAGVLVATAGLAVPSRVDARPGGSTMFKLAIAAAVLTAAGTTAYIVHAQTSSPAQASRVAPAVARGSVQPAATPFFAPATPSLKRTPTLMPPPGGTEPDVATVIPRDQIQALRLETGPSRGPTDAPVTIVVFQDNMCTFCGTALGTLDQLVDEYPSKLRIVLKQFPVHTQARLSSEALYAADAQGKFWELHDVILQHQDDLSRDALINYARGVGLDVDAFTTALDHHSYASNVEADMQSGKDIGVRGTPSFVINGRAIAGARPIEDFRALIDAALDELK